LRHSPVTRAGMPIRVAPPVFSDVGVHQSPGQGGRTWPRSTVNLTVGLFRVDRPAGAAGNAVRRHPGVARRSLSDMCMAPRPSVVGGTHSCPLLLSATDPGYSHLAFHGRSFCRNSSCPFNSSLAHPPTFSTAKKEEKNAMRYCIPCRLAIFYALSFSCSPPSKTRQTFRRIGLGMPGQPSCRLPSRPVLMLKTKSESTHMRPVLFISSRLADPRYPLSCHSSHPRSANMASISA